jgi:hypothetical protein
MRRPVDEMPTLRTALLDVLYETRNANLKLILGGGYGLYLKRELLRVTGTRTLLAEWPEARSTNDLDLFLRPELLINAAQLKPLATAIQNLGYKAITGAEKYQFAKPGIAEDQQGSLKIDLLTGPSSQFQGTRAKVDDRRVRPRPSVDLHAHHVDEAVTLEEGLLSTFIEGVTSGGKNWRGKIYLPHPFTFTMMKLFAYRDRNRDTDKALGGYHALDLYSIIAMMAENEWKAALQMSSSHANDPPLIEARGIIKEHFAKPSSEGVLRIRESPYYKTTFQIDEFRAALAELFHVPLAPSR